MSPPPATMATLLSTLVRATVGASARDAEAAEALARGMRLLNMYVRVGDADGQVQAADALGRMQHPPSRESRARSMVEQGVLPCVVVILKAERPGPCRAAMGLLAEVAGGSAELRSAVVQSGVLRPLMHHLNRSVESECLREGARVLKALAADVGCVPALLREGAPHALRRMCRSDAVQCHALAVVALGLCAQADRALLLSPSLPRVLCRVAAGSVLDARLAATSALQRLISLPSRRAALLDAHAVAVLLRCCESLNEALRLSALEALTCLASAAGVPPPGSASPADLEAEAKAAAEAQRRSLAEMLQLEARIGIGNWELGMRPSPHWWESLPWPLG